jgi:hypothetical protein
MCSGFGKNNKTGTLAQYEFKPSDVAIDDLGRLLIDPATLPSEEQSLFFNFLAMADKAAAHFTTPTDHDWARTHDVILRIDWYLKLNLYDHIGRALEDAAP